MAIAAASIFAAAGATPAYAWASTTIAQLARTTAQPPANSAESAIPLTPEQAAKARADEALADAQIAANRPVFGSQLFTGPAPQSRLRVSDHYALQPGDSIAVRVYGARNADIAGVIDQNGVFFLPQVGPIRLAGRTAGELQSTIRDAVRQKFTDSVEVYATIVSPGSIGVYVSGKVLRPGRFLGSAQDDILYYLGQAGGVDANRGSFRTIEVKRDGRTIATVDLYAFLLSGDLPQIDFRDGDVIVVAERGPVVAVSGDVRSAFTFELDPKAPNGGAIASLAVPEPKATDVVLSGIRDGRPYVVYLSRDEFRTTPLRDGDSADFRADAVGDKISVAVQSTISHTPSLYVLPRDARLTELLALIPVDDAAADLAAIHVERRSVAINQKKALEDGLNRLQRDIVFSSAQGAESARLQASEAQLVSQFIDRARSIQIPGTVSVMHDGELVDMRLEDGDIVIIPDATDVVMVAGEAISPGAFVATANMTVRDYIDRAGGFARSADKGGLIVRHRDGTAERVSDNYVPRAGDQILILPKVSGKFFAFAKDISQIIFQIALTTATVLRI